MAFVSSKHGIPKILWVAADETGANLLAVERRTIHFKGESSVPVVGMGDKRQITCMLGHFVFHNTFLPAQLVFEGKTAAVHPEHNNYPDKLVFTHSSNHWVTAETTRQWVAEIVVPALLAQKELAGYPADHPAGLLWDVYVQHSSAAMLEWIKTTYPWLKVVFIPAGCTGFLQPADVGLNAPLMRDLEKAATKRLEQAFDDESTLSATLSVRALRQCTADTIAQSMARIASNGVITKTATKIGLDLVYDAATVQQALAMHKDSLLWIPHSPKDAVSFQGSQQLMFFKGAAGTAFRKQQAKLAKSAGLNKGIPDDELERGSVEVWQPPRVRQTVQEALLAAEAGGFDMEDGDADLLPRQPSAEVSASAAGDSNSTIVQPRRRKCGKCRDAGHNSTTCQAIFLEGRVVVSHAQAKRHKKPRH